MNNDKQFVAIFCSIFGGIGTIFTITGVLIAVHTHSSVATVKTQGTVIDFERKRSVDSEGYSTNYYYPIVSFTPTSGKPSIFESHTGSNPPAFKKGQQVEVVYNPQKPNSAMINSWFELWFLPTIFIGMGLLFTFLTGVILISAFPRLMVLKRE